MNKTLKNIGVASALMATASTGAMTSVNAAVENNLLYDVKDSIFYTAIENVVNNGIFTVYRDGSFRANEIMQREKIAKFIYLYLQKKEGFFQNESNLSPYSDIRSDNHYAKYVTGLNAAGIMTGYADGTFGYQKSMTRAELLTVLSRVRTMIDSKAPAITDEYAATVKHHFKDVPESYGLYKYIEYAVGQGFIAANDYFHPDNAIRKDEAAALINRILLEKYMSEHKDEEKQSNVAKESPFYNGEKLTFASNDSSAILEQDNPTELILTLDRKSELDGKFVYIDKSKVSLQVDDMPTGVKINKIKLIQTPATLTYKLELSDSIEPMSNIKFIYNTDSALIATMLTVENNDFAELDGLEDENNTDTTEDVVNDDTNSEDTTSDDTVTEDTTSDDTVTEDTSTDVVSNGVVIESIDFNDYDTLPTSQSVPFMKIKITNNNSDVAKIHDITFENSGLGNEDYLDNMKIINEDHIVLTNSRDLDSDGQFTVRFDDDYEIPSGETVILTLVGDIIKGSSISGQSYQMKIVSADDITGTNLDFATDMEFPVVGKSFDFTESEVGTISIRKGDAETEVNVGDENVLITSFFMDNTSTNTLKVRTIGLNNGGTFKESYLGNMKLINITDGEVVVSENPTIIKDKIFFVLPENVEIKQGETKLFEVRADINGEKDETIALYIDEASDVSVYREYGYDMKFDARVTYSDFDLDAADHNTLNVIGGKVSISAGNDSNSDLSKSDTSVEFGKFNITSNDEEISIENITIEMLGKNESTSTNIVDLASYESEFDDWGSKINSLRLVDLDTGNILGSIVNPVSNNNRITFDINNYLLGGDDNKVLRLAIVGNVSSTAGINDEYYFKVITSIGEDGFQATTTVDDDDLEASNLSPTTSITLDKRTIKDAVLTVQTSSENYKDTLIKGSNQLNIVSFLFKAPSVSTVKLKTLKLKFMDPDYGEAGQNSSSVANSFQNVTIYNGDEVWASAEDIVAENDGTGYVTFNDINKTLEENEEVILTVKADITNNASADDEFYVQIESDSDVSGTDANSINVSISDGIGAWDNPAQTLFKNTIQEQGEVTLAVSPDTPKADLIAAGSDDDYFAVYKAELSVSNENVEMSKISFKYGATTNDSGKENLANGVLYIDGKQVGSEKSFSTNGITFDFSEDDRDEIEALTIGKDKVITLELRVKSKEDEESIKRGGIVSFELDNSDDALEFYGVDSQEKLTYTNNNSVSLVGSGNTFKYYYSLPSFEKYDGSYDDIIPAEQQVLYVAKVKAEGAYRLLLESLAIKKSGQATITNLRAYVSDTGVSTSAEDLVTASDDQLFFDKGTSIKSLKLTKDSSTGTLINAGEYIYVTVVGDLNNTFKGNALSISVEPSVTTGEFVWHDNTSTNVNVALDNTYIKDLPDTKSWVNTQDVSDDTANPVLSTVAYSDENTNGTIDTVTVVLDDASDNIYGSNVHSFIFKNEAGDLFRADNLEISGKTLTFTTFAKYDSENDTWNEVDSGDEKFLSTNTGEKFSMYYTAEGDAIRDSEGNAFQTIASDDAVSVTDNAKPVLIATTTSEDNLFGTDSTGTISFIFSEAMSADVSLDDIQAGIEVEATDGSTFDEDMTTVLNDDLVADATVSITPTTTNIDKDTIVVTADGTNTASSDAIVKETTAFRIKAGQTTITGADSSNSVAGTTVVK